MALGDLYVSVDDLRAYLNIGDPLDDDLVAAVSAAAQNIVDQHCGRQFNDAGTTSARVYAPDGRFVHVDDFSTTSGLAVAIGSNGSFTETLTINTDFHLEPLNGIVSGVTGWPYKRIVTSGRCMYPGPTVQVTARWGWAAVPDGVQTAVKIQAASVLDRRNSPNGTIGTGDFIFEMRRAKLDPTVLMLLQPYVRTELAVV